MRHYTIGRTNCPRKSEQIPSPLLRQSWSIAEAPEDTSYAVLDRAATLRWPIGQCFEECKSHLDLRHYEGYSYPGWDGKKRNPPDDGHGSQAVVQYDGVHIFAHAENSLITHKRNHCAYLPHRKRMISCLL